MIYYVSEVTALHSFAKAARIEAKSLTGAKRSASRYQMFQDTILYLGETVDRNGFIIDPIAVKRGRKWVDLS